MTFIYVTFYLKIIYNQASANSVYNKLGISACYLGLRAIGAASLNPNVALVQTIYQRWAAQQYGDADPPGYNYLWSYMVSSALAGVAAGFY